jgi:ribonuclease VapC
MIVDTSALIAIARNKPERTRFQDAIEADPVRIVSTAAVLEGAIVMMHRAGRARFVGSGTRREAPRNSLLTWGN